MKSGLRRLLNLTGGTPVPFAAPGRFGLNLFSGQSNNEIYLRTYGTSGTIFSIVTTLATAVSMPEWHLYRKAPVDGRVRYTTGDQGSDQRTEVVSHAALTLWKNPNPFTTTFEFVEASAQSLELTGEAWWVLGRTGASFPTSMWNVRADRMQPVPSPDKFLQGYQYNAPDGSKIPLGLDEVILVKYPNPLDPYRGLGPVQALLVQIDAMRYGTEFNRNFFLNSADPGSIITVPDALSDREWDEFTNRWRESHQGVSRAHRVAVLENGMQWAGPASPTQKDMDFANLIDVGRDMLREGWGIHKSMLGNAEDVNRANATTAEEVFGSWKVIPRLNRLRNSLNNRLLPLFGSTGQGVEFDYENPLPDDREADNSELAAKATAAQMLVAAGYDPADVLEAVGLPDMGVAEKPAPAPSAPPSPDDGTAADPAAAAATAPPAVEAELAHLLRAGLKELVMVNGSH